MYAVRTISGEEYCVNSLIGLVDALFRVINDDRKKKRLRCWTYSDRRCTPGFEGFVKVFDERVRELAKNDKLKKKLKEGETDEGLTKAEYESLVASLDRLKPAELQRRVFLHCGAWFSWRGGHYYRLLSEVTGPHVDAEGNHYFEFQVELGGENTKNWNLTVRLIKHNKLPQSSRIYEKYSKTAYDDLSLYMSKQHPDPKVNQHFYTTPKRKANGLPSDPQGE